MSRFGFFYRHARAGELLELFLVAAVVSLLGTRFWLHLASYPTLGGHHLHIAHILFGGLLMMIAVVLLVTFIGIRVQRLASLVAGVGFGLFIDELGKFITQDNNYFYSPTIALIYLVFVVLFLTFRWLGRARPLSPRENLLNALVMSEEVVIEDLDQAERAQVLRYLAQSDPAHPLVTALTRTLRQAPAAAPAQPSFWHRWQQFTQRAYERLVTHRWGRYILDVIFIIQAGAIVALLLASLIDPNLGFIPTRLHFAEWLDFWSSMVSASFVIVGVLSFRRPRLYRYHLFAIALLIDIFVSHVFEFYQDHFEALPGLVVSVVLYVGVRFVIAHERRRRVV